MNQQAFQTKAEIIKAIENNFIEWLTFQGKLTNSDYFETDEIKRVICMNYHFLYSIILFGQIP